MEHIRLDLNGLTVETFDINPVDGGAVRLGAEGPGAYGPAFMMKIESRLSCEPCIWSESDVC